jgi:hypothetical protein
MRAQLHLLPRPASAIDRLEDAKLADLKPTDVACQVKAAHSATWQEKKLDGVTWQHAGHGVYALTLEPGEVPACDEVVVLVEGRAGLRAAFEPILRTLRIVPRCPRLVPGELPVTKVCGRLIALDGKPRVKTPVTFRVHQPPLLSSGIAVTGDVTTIETDDKGYFETDIVTGACVAVQIQAINYNRVVVIPPPPAPGIPIRLFSI